MTGDPWSSPTGGPAPTPPRTPSRPSRRPSGSAPTGWSSTSGPPPTAGWRSTTTRRSPTAGRSTRSSPSSCRPTVCELAEALAACGDLLVNVEIKADRPGSGAALAAPVVEACRAWGGRVLVSSFDPATVDEVRRLDAGRADRPAHVPARPPGRRGRVAWVAERGHAAWHPLHAMVDDEAVVAAHAAGLAVNTWTVDDPGADRRARRVGRGCHRHQRRPCHDGGTRPAGHRGGWMTDQQPPQWTPPPPPPQPAPPPRATRRRPATHRPHLHPHPRRPPPPQPAWARPAAPPPPPQQWSAPAGYVPPPPPPGYVAGGDLISEPANPARKVIFSVLGLGLILGGVIVRRLPVRQGVHRRQRRRERHAPRAAAGRRARAHGRRPRDHPHREPHHRRRRQRQPVAGGRGDEVPGPRGRHHRHRARRPGHPRRGRLRRAASTRSGAAGSPSGASRCPRTAPTRISVQGFPHDGDVAVGDVSFSGLFKDFGIGLGRLLRRAPRRHPRSTGSAASVQLDPAAPGGGRRARGRARGARPRRGSRRRPGRERAVADDLEAVEVGADVERSGWRRMSLPAERRADAPGRCGRKPSVLNGHDGEAPVEGGLGHEVERPVAEVRVRVGVEARSRSSRRRRPPPVHREAGPAAVVVAEPGGERRRRRTAGGRPSA